MVEVNVTGMFGKKKDQQDKKPKGTTVFWVYRAKCLGQPGVLPANVPTLSKKGNIEFQPPGYGLHPCGWHHFTSKEKLPTVEPDNSKVPCVQCGGKLVGLAFVTEVRAKDAREALRSVSDSRTSANMSRTLSQIAGLLQEAMQKLECVLDESPIAVLGLSREHDFALDTDADAFCWADDED